MTCGPARLFVAHLLSRPLAEAGDDRAAARSVRGHERSPDRRRAGIAAGFVHGVLNTDNINITGESFDYGPWRFLPVYDPASPPPISTRPAFTPSAASPKRRSGTSSSWPAL